jgi:D-glycero-alpha-D-manno-heptose 1-phosphate guanylyltransferase
MSHAVASAVILAGGLGTRLRDAVPDLPKPMAPVNGRPFLQHQMDYWIGQGIRHFVLSVGYRHEVIMERFGTSYRSARIDYAVENAPLGTGGGLLLAVGKLIDQKPFLLLNGDTFFEVSLDGLATFYTRSESDWTMSLFATTETGRYMGLEVAADGRILSLRSTAGEPGRLANGGVYLVKPELLNEPAWQPGARLSLEDDIMPTLLERGARFHGYECHGRFIDIGVPEDYRRSASMLAA